MLWLPMLEMVEVEEVLHQVIMEISQPLALHQQFLMLDLWVMLIWKFLQAVLKTLLPEDMVLQVKTVLLQEQLLYTKIT